MNSLKNILFISYDGLTDPLGQSQIIPYLIGLINYGYRFTILSCEKVERYSSDKTRRNNVKIALFIFDLNDTNDFIQKLKYCMEHKRELLEKQGYQRVANNFHF